MNETRLPRTASMAAAGASFLRLAADGRQAGFDGGGGTEYANLARIGYFCPNAFRVCICPGID